MNYETKMIERYNELTTIVKNATKELDALKAQFLSTNGGETETHLIVIKESLREIIANRKEFENKFGQSFLNDNGLIRSTIVRQVVVTAKSMESIA